MPEPLPPGPSHMSPDEFRRRGREVVEWVASYMERVGGLPVTSAAQPGEIAAMLPDAPPEHGEPFDALMADLARVVEPGLTHWQSPRFFGYFPCNSTAPAILADLLSSAINAQGMLWSTSPAYTEIETRVLDWLGEALGLPARLLSAGAGGGSGGGVIQGTASEAAVVCLIAARDRARRATGAPIERLTAYTSSQAHSSIAKGARVVGLEPDHLRLVDVDDRLAMRAGDLAARLGADRARGLVPCFVAATLGTTSSGAIDPLGPIGEAVRAQGGGAAWLHADGAYAGAALVCPEHRAMIAGAERCDSFNMNPHKWLLTTFDCSALWVADRAPLLEALSINPEYLRNAASASGRVTDYRDWQIPLGRRFRALKLWFVLRWYGVEGLRAHIRRSVALAELAESLLLEDPRFELAAPRSLSLLCLRLRDDSDGARTRALLDRVNATRRAFFTHTTLPVGPDREPRFVIRMAIGSTTTGEADVREAITLLRASADDDGA